MKNKFTEILFGIILILSGILFYFRQNIALNIGLVLMFIAGIGFVLIYINKNSKFSLFLGIYFIYLSLVRILSLIFIFRTGNLILGGFLCCPGAIFDIIYIRERKANQLTTGNAFIAAGLSIVLGAGFFSGILAGIGASLVTDSLCTQRGKNTPQTIIGFVLVVAGLKDVIFRFVNINGTGNIIITALLVLAGLIIIAKSILRSVNNEW